MSARSLPIPTSRSPILARRPTSSLHRKALDLAEKARGRKMTSREIFEQKVSFVYGNLPDRSDLSKAQVRQFLREHRGEE